MAFAMNVDLTANAGDAGHHVGRAHAVVVRHNDR